MWQKTVQHYLEDLKQIRSEKTAKKIQLHIHNNMLKGINLDMGIIILGNMKIIAILNKVVNKQIIILSAHPTSIWGIKSSTKTADLNIIN
jgi:hypothetical protein